MHEKELGEEWEKSGLEETTMKKNSDKLKRAFIFFSFPSPFFFISERAKQQPPKKRKKKLFLIDSNSQNLFNQFIFFVQ